jgi:diacylglycerol kinase family enzyme
MAYGAVGLRTAWETVGTPARVRADGERIRGDLLLAVVANIPLYGGTVRLTPEARMDDGVLHLELFFGHSVLAAVQHLGSVLAGRRDETDQRPHMPVRAVRILAEARLPVHLDAEPFGSTPMRFEVRPRSLNLLVPPGAPPDLFVAPPGDPARQELAEVDRQR